uniref:DNA helicase n=1 Tax=Caenorhabditis japonica TaxID=281687 RepID=A0A8R1E3J8_CAEJA
MSKKANSTEVWLNSKVSVKFPFEPYECQRIFMRNVVDVLDRKMDAALESPTGTGKTLSLLCSVLAWVQHQKVSRPLDFATWQSSGAGGSKNDATENNLKSQFVPTVYYASRTHSQLEQVVHELNRTEYKWVKTTILGSREHFCINQKVKKIKESNRQAHVCRGLVKKRTCHYYNQFDSYSTEKISEIFDTGEAMDIEDFVKFGTKNSLCPYYLTRQRSETAELILLPYNYVIDPKMRRRHKLDLKNSIVIFDEAHNLESICESNASAELTSTTIAMCIEELKKVLALLVDEEETARAEADVITEGFTNQKVDLTKKLIENLRTEDLMAALEKVFSLEENMDNLYKSDALKSTPPLEGKSSDGEVLLVTLEKSGFDGNSVERVVDVLRDATSYLLSKNEEVALTEKGDGMEKLADFLLSIFSTHAQEVAAAVGDESMQNTITEMLTENPPTCYEELTESIRSAASTATHATHQLSRISEATKKMMMSRFQMIHAGQTKNADLAKINNEVRRSLENDLDKWREVKSLEAAVKGRSLKKTKRALTLKSSPFTNLERPDGSTTYNRPEIRKLVLTHFSNLYAATTREPQSRYNHPDEPEILQHEVEHAIVTSKTNISPGPDQITMLQLKLGIESIAPHLTAALNQVLTNGRTPEDWKTVKISLLPKTTNPKKVKDYRPVALSSIVSKLFTKILTRRITAKSEDYLEESQAGFRRGRGCADNIQVVAQMWEKCTEFKIPLVAVFLDFTCAFDNVNWTKISEVLNNLQSEERDSGLKQLKLFGD